VVAGDDDGNARGERTGDAVDEADRDAASDTAVQGGSPGGPGGDGEDGAGAGARTAGTGAGAVGQTTAGVATGAGIATVAPDIATAGAAVVAIADARGTGLSGMRVRARAAWSMRIITGPISGRRTHTMSGCCRGTGAAGCAAADGAAAAGLCCVAFVNIFRSGCSATSCAGASGPQAR
jgi:hypothetical protein